MRRAILLVAVVGMTACAGHQVPLPDPIARFVFVETLPPETEVCVYRDPFRGELSCVSLEELRQFARGLRRASVR